MRIDITITDREYSAHFVEGCLGVWGIYRGTREHVNDWLREPRNKLERRWAEVHGVDAAVDGKASWDDADHDEQMYRWIVEECPLIALAVMCAEWDS